MAIVVRGEPRPAQTLRMLNACKINERFCGFGPQGQHGTGRQAQMSSDTETDRQAGWLAGVWACGRGSVCGWSVTSLRNWQAIYRFIFAHCQITSTDYFITKA